MIIQSVFLRRKLLLALSTCALTMSLVGCHREYYRKQADDEARALVEEKSSDPRWAMPGFNIEMHPASRYNDSDYDPVKPPMPPDDPEAHELMHCVYGKKGWAKWHENGDRPGLENPVWKQCLDQYVTRSPNGTYVLRLEDSVRLALIHSPQYQQQVETLYLSSLDVSTERFRLQTQFFGGNGTDYIHRGAQPVGSGVTNSSSRGAGLFGGGPFIPGFGTGSTTDTLRTTTGFEGRRRLATAGELVVGFANSFVWQFAGPNQNATASIASFGFLQPLLRQGGRVIGLETLTLAERNLLANVRAMYRYRQGFFTQIAIGNNDNVAGPQRLGGLQGGTGLTGFSGQGTTGLGGVGDATGFGSGGGGANAGAGGAAGAITGFAGGGEGTVGGFIGLLQQMQQTRNTQAALNAELRTLALLEANYAAGFIDIGQVDQFRQSIETERANYLQASNTLESLMDNFKSSVLGLPPNLPIELNDSLIQPFQFIDPDLSAVQDGLAKISTDLGKLNEKPAVADVEAIADRIAASRRDIEGQFAAVLNDLQKLDSLSESRFKEVTAEEQQATRGEWVRLNETRQRLIDTHAETGQKLSEIRSQLSPKTTDTATDELVTLTVRLASILNELSLVQARSRLDVITVQSVELHPLEALAIARCNRVDWMNRRAALVNTWRLIEFNANALETGLDLVFSGEVGTTGDNPLNFNHTTGGLRAGLRFDAPFTRLLERNNYRQQLILYQQVRRGLIQFEDATHRTLRQHLRLLNQRRTNLEIQRRAVVIAIRRVDQTRENFNKPVASSAPGTAAQQFGPTAAFDLLTALSDLRSAQNNFMGVWLQYYSSHMQLIRELGVMQLDENGMWIQESLDNVERMWSEDCVLPPEIPAQWFKDLDANGTTPPVNETGLNDADSSEQPVPPEPQTTPVPPIQPPDEPVLPNSQNRNEASRKRRGAVPRLLDVRAVLIAKPLSSTETMAASKRPVIVPLEQGTDADRSNTPSIMPVSKEELQTR